MFKAVLILATAAGAFAVPGAADPAAAATLHSASLNRALRSAERIGNSRMLLTSRAKGDVACAATDDCEVNIDRSVQGDIKGDTTTHIRDKSVKVNGNGNGNKSNKAQSFSSEEVYNEISTPPPPPPPPTESAPTPPPPTEHSEEEKTAEATSEHAEPAAEEHAAPAEDGNSDTPPAGGNSSGGGGPVVHFGDTQKGIFRSG